MCDYFSAAETEQFSFSRAPMALIKNEEFKSVSTGVKLLYPWVSYSGANRYLPQVAGVSGQGEKKKFIVIWLVACEVHIVAKCV